MKRKHGAAWILTTVLLLSLLSGCGSSNTQEPDVSPESEHAASVHQPAVEESAGPGEAAPNSSSETVDPENGGQEAEPASAPDADISQNAAPTVSAQNNPAGDDGEPDDMEEVSENTMHLLIGEQRYTATLVENSSAQALKELLAEGPLTIDMRDYGNMEKVGGFGTSLPTNDESITTQAGDLILYQGNSFVIYYAPNSWSFTRLGRIDNVTAEELREILGSGNVSVTLSLPD